jgi:hypothetical protein
MPFGELSFREICGLPKWLVCMPVSRDNHAKFKSYIAVKVLLLRGFPAKSLGDAKFLTPPKNFALVFWELKTGRAKSIKSKTTARIKVVS